MNGAAICFLATSKSGLGHLRRVATIARSLRRKAPEREIHLVSNARPEGLEPADMAAFDHVQLAERTAMAQCTPVRQSRVVVLDTIVVPGIEALAMPRVLILREAPIAELKRFRLPEGQRWDQVVVANPQNHWMPDPAVLPANAYLPAGWIFRPTGTRTAVTHAVPQVLVATGGGGTKDTSHDLYAAIDGLLARVRRAGGRFQVVQAIGPRATGFGVLTGADRVVDPGGRLNDLFREADVVLSTAGYNSVLELATTDTPTMLMPIARSIDDQVARARLWAPHLGAWMDAEDPAGASAWLLDQVAAPRRRAPVDLGDSGEARAADAILELT